MCISQVYGTGNINAVNRDYLSINGLGIGEESNIPINLQLSQPQQVNYDTPARTTKTGYGFLYTANILF